MGNRKTCNVSAQIIYHVNGLASYEAVFLFLLTPSFSLTFIFSSGFKNRLYLLYHQNSERLELELPEALRALRAYSLSEVPETVELSVRVDMSLKKVGLFVELLTVECALCFDIHKAIAQFEFCFYHGFDIFFIAICSMT